MIVNDLMSQAQQQQDEAMERLRFTVTYAQQGLNASLLANGGALIALFTLIAPHRELGADLWPSGVAFAAALALTLLAWLFATISQDRYYAASQQQSWNLADRAMGKEPTHNDMKHYTLGTRFMYGAYGCVILSFVGFITGSLLTLRAF